MSLFGGAAQLLKDPLGTLKTLKALGVQDVRVDIRWNTIAPDPTSRTAPSGFDASNPASYPPASWAPYDRAIATAHNAGIGVLATVGGPAPAWAEGADDPRQAGEPAGIWKPSPAAFGAFVKAVATRYGGGYRPRGAPGPLPRITFWSLWNEPNYGQDLAPQAIDRSAVEVAPALYRGLLDAGWSALHSARPSDTILFGEFAPRGLTVGNVPGDFGGMVPLRFLRALYCVNASLQRLSGPAATARGCPSLATSATAAAFRAANPALFDASGLAVHLYPEPGNHPPTARATGLPGYADFADFASLPELQQTLDRLQAAYSSTRPLPIYSTEFGFQTDPPEPTLLSPAAAAGYMNEAEYLSWRDPRVRSFDQYLLTDAPPVPGKIGFDTGLEFANGSPKATFFAYRMPIYMPVTTAATNAPLEIWGCVRPAPDAAVRSSPARAQQVQIEFRPAAGGPFASVRSVTLPRSSCYFTVTVPFAQSGTVRLRWTPPGGGADFSRPVAVTVR